MNPRNNSKWKVGNVLIQIIMKAYQKLLRLKKDLE
jgi:hypothetical protein